MLPKTTWGSAMHGILLLPMGLVIYILPATACSRSPMGPLHLARTTLHDRVWRPRGGSGALPQIVEVPMSWQRRSAMAIPRACYLRQVVLVASA